MLTGADHFLFVRAQLWVAGSFCRSSGLGGSVKCPEDLLQGAAEDHPVAEASI